MESYHADDTNKIGTDVELITTHRQQQLLDLYITAVLPCARYT